MHEIRIGYHNVTFKQDIDTGISKIIDIKYSVMPGSHYGFDPECRRDGLYLERLPLASQETNMKEMFKYLRPVHGWKSEFGRI